MRLFGVSMVRNEADVLEAWARYHLQMFDGLIIADHGSIDGTSQVLSGLIEEGLPVEAAGLDHTVFDQTQVITDLARRAVGRGADWVFPLDGDEFLNPRGSLPRDALGEEAPQRPLAVPWETYVPRVDDPVDAVNPLRRMTWRLSRESRPFDKVVIPADLLVKASTRVGRGSHLLLDDGTAISPGRAPDGWALAHLPVRSLEQITTKVLVGWISSLANPDRGPRTAYHWKKLFHFLIERDSAELDLEHLAMTYLDEEIHADDGMELVRDPLPPDLVDFELKYTAGAVGSPMKALALAAESQAVELAELRRQLT